MVAKKVMKPKVVKPKVVKAKAVEAKRGDQVKVHYTGKLDDNTVFDTSVEREPLEFAIGEGRLLEDFEQAVVGMSPGEKKTVKIASDKAYGPHHEGMIMVVDKKEFPEDLKPWVGQRFQIQRPDGQEFVVAVTAITRSKITLDGNHPLAGKDLTFEIQLAEIS